MANRKHPTLTALRVTPAERALIDAAARTEGVPVTTLLRRIVLPAVGRTVAGAAAALCAEPGDVPPRAA